MGLSNLVVFRGNEQSCPNLPTDPDNHDSFCGAVLNYGTLNVSQVTFDRNQANNGAGAVDRQPRRHLDSDGGPEHVHQSEHAVHGWNLQLGDAVVSNSTFVDNGRAAIENRTGATMDVVNSTFTGSWRCTQERRDARPPQQHRRTVRQVSPVRERSTLTASTSIPMAPAAMPPRSRWRNSICSHLRTTADRHRPSGLGASSVAVDAGDDAVCVASPVDGIDQRGVDLPVGPSCDVGAFEAVGSITGVVKDADGLPLEGATVTAGPASVVTAADGTFDFGDLPIGEFVVAIAPPQPSDLAILYFPSSFNLIGVVPVSSAAGVPLDITLSRVGTVERRRHGSRR